MTDPMPAVRDILGFPVEVDHEAEAKKASRNATTILSEDPALASVIAEGQLHATLALVEATQALVTAQRLTGLIVWTTRPGYRPSAREQLRIDLGLDA